MRRQLCPIAITSITSRVNSSYCEFVTAAAAAATVAATAAAVETATAATVTAGRVRYKRQYYKCIIVHFNIEGSLNTRFLTALLLLHTGTHVL
jgi:hypothetical protein